LVAIFTDEELLDVDVLTRRRQGDPVVFNVEVSGVKGLVLALI